jgi:hypothetical protein
MDHVTDRQSALGIFWCVFPPHSSLYRLAAACCRPVKSGRRLHRRKGCFCKDCKVLNHSTSKNPLSASMHFCQNDKKYFMDLFTDFSRARGVWYPLKLLTVVVVHLYVESSRISCCTFGTDHFATFQSCFHIFSYLHAIILQVCSHSLYSYGIDSYRFDNNISVGLLLYRAVHNRGWEAAHPL